MVVDQQVDINPVSQYVLDKFVDDETIVLADLDVNDIVTLSGKVDEFDLTAAPDASLTELLAQLEAEVGEFVESEIEVIESEPADETLIASVAGTWALMQGSVAQHDSEAGDFGTTASDISLEKINVAGGAATGEVEISSDSLFLDTEAQMGVYNGGQSLTAYTETQGDTFSFTADLDSNGNLVIEEPFSEELEAVAAEDLDGPDFGWRYPPSTILINSSGNDNLKLVFNKSAAVRYETVDTNSDGIKDAINPDAKSGDEVFVDYTVILKQAETPPTQLTGDYGYLTYQQEMDEGGYSYYSVESGKASFTGATTFDINYATSEIERIRNLSTGDVSVSMAADQLGSGASVSYSIDSSTGIISLSNGYLQGVITADNSFMAMLGVENTGPDTGFIHRSFMATKLPASVMPDLSNAQYKLYTVISGLDSTGRIVAKTLTSDSTLAFNSDGTLAALYVEDNGIERANDTAQIETLIGQSATLDGLAVTVGSGENLGRVKVSLGDLSDNGVQDESVMDGFVSEDGNLMLFKLKTDFSTTTVNEYEIGFVIAVKK